MTDDLSDEDKALFRQAVKNVTRFASGKKIDTPSNKPISHQPASRHTTTYQPATNYNLSNHYETSVDSESILSFSLTGVPRKQFLQLRTGQISIQKKIDLHGLRPDEAQDRLCEFIDQEYSSHHRCVLVIHGKGGHRNEAPVLKNLVNTWLKQLPQILAFHSALPSDGGAGALYVLLKRQRI